MINVLFFAYLQDAVGTEKIVLNEAPLTVAELKQTLINKYHLSGLEAVMVAVNEEYANDDDVIQDGDTVAFIPPVSGG